jgi:hypothetical protein
MPTIIVPIITAAPIHVPADISIGAKSAARKATGKRVIHSSPVMLFRWPSPRR